MIRELSLPRKGPQLLAGRSPPSAAPSRPARAHKRGGAPPGGAAAAGAPCASLNSAFLRSMMRSAPSGVHSPMSPVWNQPSSSSTCAARPPLDAPAARGRAAALRGAQRQPSARPGTGVAARCAWYGARRAAAPAGTQLAAD